MAEIKDFDQVRTTQREARGEAPQFKLLGETWTCNLVAPAHAMRDLVGAENSVEGTFVYLKQLLIPEQREAFEEKVLASDDIELSLLSDLVEWLTEQYSGRPTERA